MRRRRCAQLALAPDEGPFAATLQAKITSPICALAPLRRCGLPLSSSVRRHRMILLLLFLVGCSSHDVAARDFSNQQIQQLSIEALEHTPDKLHFAPNSVQFKWVLFI